MNFIHTPGTATIRTPHATVTVTHRDGAGVADITAASLAHRVNAYGQLKMAVRAAHNGDRLRNVALVSAGVGVLVGMFVTACMVSVGAA